MKLEDIVAEQIRQSGNLQEQAYVLRMLLENHTVGIDGELLSIRALVGSLHGLKIEIHPNEHTPAHFHVRGGDVDAAFTIEDCRMLEGKIGGHEQRIVRFWYKHSRKVLIQIWNDTRPSDCPVGPIRQ